MSSALLRSKALGTFNLNRRRAAIALEFLLAKICSISWINNILLAVGGMY